MMGYILPLPHFQYMEYQKRIIDTKQNPHYIEKPYKVTLETNGGELAKDGAVEANNNYKAPTAPQKVEQGRLYAELTGKGGLINEVV